MARQTGPEYRTGTIDHIVYYKLFGEHYYLRTKSTLSRKRFLQDPAFALSRQRSREFGSAAQVASFIYQQLPRQNRGRGFMGKLIGQVHKALFLGKSLDSIIQELIVAYGGILPLTLTTATPKARVKAKHSENAVALPQLSKWVVTSTGQLDAPDIYREPTLFEDIPPDS